jgi:hypothetical protein
MCRINHKTASNFRCLHGYIPSAIFRKAPPNSTPYSFREKEVRTSSQAANGGVMPEAGAPSVPTTKLTETQEITPYKWAHPDEDR